MSLRTRRRDALLADAHLQRERALWTVRTRVLRERIDAHREWWIIGAGLLGGAFVGWTPRRSFARLGRVAHRTLSFALRSPIAAVLLAGIVKKTDAARTDATP